MTAWNFPATLPPSFHTPEGARDDMATISDVAARAGVGIGTVSRVLNGSHQVRPSTRAKVHAAMRGTGLPPDPLVRREQGQAPGLRRCAGAVLRRAVVVPASARHRAVAATARPRDRAVQRRRARSRPSPAGGSSTPPARRADHHLAPAAVRRRRPPRRGAVPDRADRHVARRVAERRDRRPQRRTDRDRAPAVARPRTHRVHR